jgi:Cyclic nucleotide-binding domain.
VLGDADLQRAISALPFLAQAPAELARDFAHQASLLRLPAGIQILSEGDRCSVVAVLLSGSVRVFKLAETGCEITLYRFGYREVAS